MTSDRAQGAEDPGSRVRARLSDADKVWLAWSCERSGVPLRVEDPEVVALAADALRGLGLLPPRRAPVGLWTRPV